MIILLNTTIRCAEQLIARNITIARKDLIDNGQVPPTSRALIVCLAETFNGCALNIRIHEEHVTGAVYFIFTRWPGARIHHLNEQDNLHALRHAVHQHCVAALR